MRQPLPYDVILFDEAQAANPAMLDILLSQSAQRILVGDPHQQIYAWRGAVNAMLQVEGKELHLSQSFRFTDEIAELATGLLQAFKGETRPIKGIPNPSTRATRAILTRTNAGAVEEALSWMERNRRVALVHPNLQEFKDTLKAAYRLYKGQATQHPEFSLFRSWQALEELIRRFPSLAAQYRPYKTLIQKYGDPAPTLLKGLRSPKQEAEAEVVVSTAHRSKGRQWTEVTLGNDYHHVVLAQERPGQGCIRILEEEVNLLYVAITRAETQVHLGPFAERLESQRLYAQALRTGRQRPCPEEGPPRGAQGEGRGLLQRLLRLLGLART